MVLQWGNIGSLLVQPPAPLSRQFCWALVSYPAGIPHRGRNKLSKGILSALSSSSPSSLFLFLPTVTHSLARVLQLQLQGPWLVVCPSGSPGGQ